MSDRPLSKQLGRVAERDGFTYNTEIRRWSDMIFILEDRIDVLEQERDRLRERCARWKAAAKVNKYPTRLFDNADDAIAWLEGGDDE